MHLLALTDETTTEDFVPALSLLAHTVRTEGPTPTAIMVAGSADVVLVDARRELAAARSLCRLLSASVDTPVVAVVDEGGLVTINGEWGIADLLLTGTGPAEVDARLRLLVDRAAMASGSTRTTVITVGDLVIDEEKYVARVRGRPLDLTYKEFELLRYLCQSPGRVYSREQLLQEVWGYDFFGGTRTVDVHIRRLRAKLGSDHESLIGTVRNVGYKAVAPAGRRGDREGGKDGV